MFTMFIDQSSHKTNVEYKIIVFHSQGAMSKPDPVPVKTDLFFDGSHREIMWQQLSAAIKLREKIGQDDVLITVIGSNFPIRGYFPEEPQSLGELILNLESELADE